MHKSIPGSQMAVIPHAAHMSNLENAAVFNQHLSSFLAQFQVV
jgi:pimeloyl-ACP methyl ester carboxylesterase